MSNDLLSVNDILIWVSFITGMAIVAVGAGLTLVVDPIWIILETLGWIIAIAIPLLINKSSKKNPPAQSTVGPI